MTKSQRVKKEGEKSRKQRVWSICVLILGEGLVNKGGLKKNAWGGEEGPLGAYVEVEGSKLGHGHP